MAKRTAKKTAKKKPATAKKTAPRATASKPPPSELVSVAERDRRLARVLTDAIARLASWKTDVDRGEFSLLLETVRYGAKVDVDDEEEREEYPAGLRGFFAVRGMRAKVPPPARVRVFSAKALQIEDVLNDSALQRLRPGRGWSAPNVAAFHRLAAMVYGLHYSDSFLNATVDAAREAREYYAKHEPAVALDLAGRQMRAAVYASYGFDDVIEVLDDVSPLYKRAKLSADDEYRFLVQVCEALDRFEPSEHDERLLSFGLRGLALAAKLDAPEQVARMHHAVATARSLGDAAERKAAAESWQRAIELERGEFYGAVEPNRRADRVQSYLVSLARLAKEDGRADDALALCVRARKAKQALTAYDQRETLNVLIPILDDARELGDRRVRFLSDAFTEDLASNTDLEGWALEQLAFYADDVQQALKRWNAPGDAKKVRARLEAIPAYAEAAEELEAKVLEERREKEELAAMLAEFA